MNQVTKFLKSISSDEDIIYRGHADFEWKLIPSIGRYFTGPWGKVVEREKKSLDEFKKRAIPYLKYTPKSDIEWLCLMQHHGCSTRLLDFTSNPLIALFFATDPSIEKDGEVIVAKYGRSYENVSNEKLFERTHDFAYFPPHITERIIGQFGSFVYSSNPIQPLSDKQIDKIHIKQDSNQPIRSELKALGISHSTLFPGLDGICKDINDSLVFDLMLEDL